MFPTLTYSPPGIRNSGDTILISARCPAGKYRGSDQRGTHSLLSPSGLGQQASARIPVRRDVVSHVDLCLPAPLAPEGMELDDWWVPRAPGTHPEEGCTALPFDPLTVPSGVEGHPDLLEQPERKRVSRHPPNRSTLCLNYIMHQWHNATEREAGRDHATAILGSG